jgi:alkyldihydroxyacetonephosphate synthase
MPRSFHERAHTAQPCDPLDILRGVPDVEAILSDLRAAVGDAAVSASPADLAAYTNDLWPKLTLAYRDRTERTPPLAVVRPTDEDAVLRAVRACARHDVPIVPYGAGSGVCGGAAPLYGGVVVDLKALDDLGSVDPATLQVDVGPGMVLQNLERFLNDDGWTLGHFPSSIYCASIGGCVAARGAGQLSSRYGKIEDMVTGLRLVTPELGILTTGSLDPGGPAIDWSPLFVGSEGTLGLITSMRLRVHPLPKAMVLRGVRFPSVDAGLDGFREILQSGLRPSVMRLYDPLDTWMAMQKANDAGGTPPITGAGDPMAGGARTRRPENAAEPRDGTPDNESSSTIFGSVASPGTLMGAVVGRLKRRAKRHRSVQGDSLMASLAERVLGGQLKDRLKPENLPMDRLLANPALLNRGIEMMPGRCLAIFGCEGEHEQAKKELEAVVAAAGRLGGVDLGPGPGEQWFRTRYHVSFKLPKLLMQGGFADTFETAAPWTRVKALYDAVRKAVAPHVLVMAHMSHAYHEGCSIYFTLAGHASTPERTAELYQRTWKAAMAAAQGVGAVLSHHHGIGVLKRDFMNLEHGDGRRFFEAARDAVDPKRVLNTGKLFPDEIPPPGPVVADHKPEELVVHPHQDGVVDAGVGWRGVDLAAELSLRGHFLPPLGREFLEVPVSEWLAGPALAAHVAVHGAWEHPLQAVEGRTLDGRLWRSGRLPRAATGPSWLPLVAGGADLPVRPSLITLRTMTPPAVRPAGFTFPSMEAAASALAAALRGLPRPLGGEILPGDDPERHRHVDVGASGALLYLGMQDPDGYAAGSQAIVDRLTEAGGEPLDHDQALAWWEDHWAMPAREGAERMDESGIASDRSEIGRCAAVASWRKAMLLVRAVETLCGGRTNAIGWLDAPLETGCTVRWRFVETRDDAGAPALVPWQVKETIRAYGARVAAWSLDADELPEGTVGGRGTPAGVDVGPATDSERFGAAMKTALEALTP